jgi:hypothetical protein
MQDMVREGCCGAAEEFVVLRQTPSLIDASWSYQNQPDELKEYDS